MIWKNASEELYQWVENFKDIFINQKKDKISDIFDVENFGIHNGVDCHSYTHYEFNEFALKCEKFGLNMNAQIVTCELKDDFFYFSLGKQEDKALFEAIFKYKNGRAIGNQYQFRIEPKIQFFKEYDGIRVERKINIKGNILVKKIINHEPSENICFLKNELEEVMGGNFYSHLYTRLEENAQSYWDTIQICTDKGIIKHEVLMRGKDHPVFRDNLFPQIINDNQTIIYNKEIYPVIVYALLENGDEKYFKYPENNVIHLEQKIKKVCLTDTLSFDWIVNS